MKKTLYVILNKKYLKGNFDNRVDILTLNKYIFSKSEKLNINNISPDPFKTALESESLTLKIDKLRSQIIKKLISSRLLNQIEDLDELLSPFIEVKLSRYFYLDSIIPEYQNYVLLNKNYNYKTSSKIDLIIQIEESYLKDKRNHNDFFNKYSIFKPKLFDGILLNIQKFFIQNIFKKRKRIIYFFR